MPESHPESAPTGDSSDSSDGGISRRSFLGKVGAAGIAASFPILPKLAEAKPKPREGKDPVEEFRPAAAREVNLKINGQKHRLFLEPRVTVLDALREHLHLTGTKKGCDHGQCGACTVHINGKRVNSCLSFAVMHEQDEITTIEGLGTPEHLHPVQEAFVKHDAYQCGYCTPGQIMSAAGLLHEPCGKSDRDVKEAMSGNICRCGAYKNITAAIQEARGNGKA